MYLKRLELHGFKSFAHKTALDFDPGLTAVVGPNGSGKSNVADALRWVMGEQSLKLLRGKKSEDVIFAGSDKKSKLSMAEVALSFDNRDRKIPLEYSEVVITRRLYRNGESDYLMNNQKVRLLDVVDVLIRSGFGATNYAVIGQGTIDLLVLAGPAEIKNLVEEASGVKPYYLKRDKTLRRLEQTSENLSKVSALLQEIEPRLRSLRRQAKRMEEREGIAKELLELQKAYFGHQTYALELELSAITDKWGLKNKSLEQLNHEIAAFLKTLEKDEQQSAKTNSFLEAWDKKFKHLEEKRLGFLEQLAEIRGKLAAHVPATLNFSEFKRNFDAILEMLRADNVEEIKQRLKALVSDLVKPKNEQLSSLQQTLTLELENITQEIEEQKQAKNRLLAEEKQKKSFLTAEEKKFRAKTLELTMLKDEQNLVLVEKARVETRLEAVSREAKEALGNNLDLTNYKQPQLTPQLPNRMSRLKHQLELAGGIDEATLTEYRETQERFDYLTNQSDDLNKAVMDLKNVIEELDQIIKKQFSEAYEKISTSFSEYFRILFNGGRAQMTLLREAKDAEAGVAETELETEEKQSYIDGIKQSASAKSYGGSAEALAKAGKRLAQEIVGIEIRATPPGKKLASIAALSGGERALTAIALLCAMLASYPSPFVVLDEVDAALDEANSIRFAKILGTLAHQTQFITITHNRETMRQAHTLYGVTMSEEGISRILSIKLDKAEAIAQ